eukprot:GHRR01017523.1.p1 GENE.GHRR01017523.1~~GHRR01017523.1.p1  ORF type:complete len:337 (+),score=79.56 GHRR01017523.1:153-1163(+)
MLLRTQQTCSGHKVLIKHQRTCCIRQRVCCSQPTTQSWPEFPIVRTRISSRAQNRLRLGGKQLPATNNTNVAVQESLLEYICRGPLLTAAGISPQEVQQQLPVWQLLGQQLAKQLSFPHDDMTDVQKLRVYRYYLPVFFWIQRQLQQHRQAYGEQQAPPLVLGISAPQGCGKSTLVEQLEQLLTWLGITAASVSIDDFYLTNAEQTAVVAAHPDNRLLGVRGNAGTHDLALGAQTLQQLKGLKAAGHSVAVPRCDCVTCPSLVTIKPQQSLPDCMYGSDHPACTGHVTIRPGSRSCNSEYCDAPLASSHGSVALLIAASRRALSKPSLLATINKHA